MVPHHQEQEEEDQEFKASLGYTFFSSSWSLSRKPSPNTNQQKCIPCKLHCQHTTLPPSLQNDQVWWHTTSILGLGGRSGQIPGSLKLA